MQHRASGSTAQRCSTAPGVTSPPAQAPAPGDARPASPDTASPGSPPRRATRAAPRAPAGETASPNPGPAPRPAPPATRSGSRTRTTTRRRRGTWPPQHPGSGRTPVAAHHHTQRGLADPLQLQVQQAPGRIAVELARLRQPLDIGHHRCPGTQLRVVDDQKPPRLGMPHRRSRMPRPQHPLQHINRHRIRAEAPDVTTGTDHLVQRVPRRSRKGPRHRLLGTLRRGRLVPHHRHRTRPGHRTNLERTRRTPARPDPPHTQGNHSAPRSRWCRPQALPIATRPCYSGHLPLRLPHRALQVTPQSRA